MERGVTRRCLLSPSRSTRAAQPLRLDRRPADAEPRLLGRPRQHHRNIVVLHLDHPPTLPADQELRGMRVVLALTVIRRTPRNTSNKRRQPFDPVDQSLSNRNSGALSPLAVPPHAASAAADRATRRPPSALLKSNTSPSTCRRNSVSLTPRCSQTAAARSSRFSVRLGNAPP